MYRSVQSISSLPPAELGVVIQPLLNQEQPVFGHNFIRPRRALRYPSDGRQQIRSRVLRLAAVSTAERGWTNRLLAGVPFALVLGIDCGITDS